jgi:branched-chain amino acid transport system substrate-binding protein
MKYDLYKGPQYYRACDHQSVQSVLIVDSRPTSSANDLNVFNIVQVDPPDEGILQTCAAEGHG